MRELVPGRVIDRLVQRPRGWANSQARAGRIPHVLLPDGQIRYDLDAIENWLATLARAAVRAPPVRNDN